MTMTARPLSVFSLLTSMTALMLATGVARADQPDHKPEPAPAHTMPAAPMPTPEEAKATLVSGNEHFVHGTGVHPHQDQKRLHDTAGGQHPFVTVLSCSDSRVPPEV